MTLKQLAARMAKTRKRGLRRYVVIAAIVTAVAGLWARMLFIGPRPVSARPASRVEPATTQPSPAETAFQKWLAAPMPTVTRNLFAPTTSSAATTVNTGRIDKTSSDEKWVGSGTDEQTAP